jgi:Tol biopolymer transport system component
MTRRRVATTLLLAAAVACQGGEPTAVPASIRLLAAGTDVGPAAKPEQSLIAYVSGRGGITDLYIMDVANGRSHWLTRDRAAAASPVWSPDGTQIAFSSNRDGFGANIWVIPSGGGTPVKYTQAGGTSPDWSSDGTRIAFTSYSGTTDISVMNADGTGQTRITSISGAWESEPVWSPDRTKIAYTSASGGPSQIWVMNADGSSPVQLTGLTDGGTSFNPAWSPDGTKIAFASFRSGRQELYIMNADGTGPTQITTGGPAEYRPRWSTQGIVFHANASGTPAIFLVNPDGTGLTQLTRGSSWSYEPAWKP